MINALIALVSLALVAVVVYDLIEIGKRRKAIALETQKVKAVEEAAKKQVIKEQSEAKYANEYKNLTAQYGDATSSFLLGSDKTKIDNYLYVFEPAATVCIKGESIPFNMIIGFSLNDDSETILHNESAYKSITETDTGSMMGRAAIGGILLGSIGALAGATTAKKETITSPLVRQSTSIIKHNYSLFLNIDDLSNPLREIELGSDINKVQTIVNIFNIIIKRNTIKYENL